jgi:hypothetical protein
MGLAQLTYPSPTKTGWQEWSWANLQHHLAIDTAILEVLGVEIVPFRIWPVFEKDFQDWLEQHQEYHNVYSQVLGIESQDLSELDLKNKSKADDWMYLHVQEHRSAATILKLPTL